MSIKEAKQIARQAGVPFGLRWAYVPGIIDMYEQGYVIEVIEDTVAVAWRHECGRL